MNNFFNKNPENSISAYYPEPLNIDENGRIHTQGSSQNVGGTSFQSQNGNTFFDNKAEQNKSPFGALPLEKMLALLKSGKSDMLSTLVSGMNGQKNPMVDALTTVMKKQNKSASQPKTQNPDATFEEM